MNSSLSWWGKATPVSGYMFQSRSQDPNFPLPAKWIQAWVDEERLRQSADICFNLVHRTQIFPCQRSKTAFTDLQSRGTGARGTRMDTFKCLYTWPVRLHLNWPIRIQQGKLYCPNVKCLSTGKALHSGNVSHWKRHQIFTKWDWKLKEPYQIV